MYSRYCFVVTLSPVCHSPSTFPFPQSRGLQFSTLGGARENQASSAASCTAGEAGRSVMWSQTHWERNRRLRKSLLVLSWATIGKGWSRKSQTVSLILPCVPTCFLFGWFVGWLGFFCYSGVLELLPRNPDFHKVSLVCGQSLKAVFSRGSRTRPERVWRQFLSPGRVCCPDPGLHTY